MSSEVYNKEQIRRRLADLPDWSLSDDGQLQAEYRFKTFTQAVLFFNAIAHLAETMNHHPDACVHGYNRLSLRLMTHSQKGITDNDFTLASQISALPRE